MSLDQHPPQRRGGKGVRAIISRKSQPHTCVAYALTTEYDAFEVVDTVSSELRFRSASEAERVLGYLCGRRVREQLEARPRRIVGHDVAILHRPPTASPPSRSGCRP